MAAGDVLRELAVFLTMDSADFSRGATAAEKRAATLDKRFKQIGSNITGGLKSSLGGFAGGIAGALTVGAITSLAKSGLDYASSLGEVAQQLGITTTELQEYRYAATQVGIEQGEMDSALARLTRTAGDAANGVKSAAAPFAQLGINIRDANGQVKSAGVLLPEIADALAKIPDPAQRASVLVDLFGKSGQKMATLLGQGSKGINNLRDAARDLGIVLSEEQIQKADETADKLAAVKTVLGANIARVVADNSASILGFANALSRLTSEIIRFMGSNPKAALAIVGTLGGARVGGVPGAIVGGLGGLYAGGRLQANLDAESKDPAYLLKRLKEERAVLAKYVKLNKENGAGIALEQQTKKVQQLTNNLNLAIAASRGLRQNFAPDIGAASQFQSLADGLIFTAPKASEAVEGLDRSIQSLIDEALPEEARMRAFIADMGELGRYADEAGWSLDRARQVAEGLAKARGYIVEGTEELPTINSDSLTGPNGELKALEAETERTTEQMVESFASMAQSVGYSLSSLAGSIKGGGVLDILSSVVQLAGTVIGGLQSAGVIKAPQARAAGGPVVPGRIYKVGERGPEYLSVGSRGYVTPNRAANDGRMRVQVVKGDLFDVIVDRRASNIAAPMAGRAAIMGAHGGVAAMQRQAVRRIP